MAVVLAEDEEVRGAAAGDEDYHEVLQAVESRWPGDASNEMRKVKPMRDSLSVLDGLALMNVRLYIPKGMRKTALKTALTVLWSGG